MFHKWHMLPAWKCWELIVTCHVNLQEDINLSLQLSKLEVIVVK